MDWSGVLNLVSTVAAAASAVFAYKTVVASAESTASQELNNQADRFSRDYAALVRAPMLAKLSVAAERICTRIELCRSTLAVNEQQHLNLAIDDVIGEGIRDVQSIFFDMRTDLMVLALAGSSNELWDRLSRFLEEIEDHILGQISSMKDPATLQTRRTRSVRIALARIERGIVAHGQDERHRLKRIAPTV
jgi:hypothetical protein